MSITRRVFGKAVGYGAGFLPLVARAMTPEEKKLVPYVGSPITTEFERLKALLDTDAWPTAVPHSLICSEDEADRKARAKSIIDLLIGNDLEGKKFLDYGCGYGDTLDVARKAGAAWTAGYEPYPLRLDGRIDTRVCSHIIGYHDVILMYDVLDHLHQDSMQMALSKARKHLNRLGSIYVRCHPYTCSTGAHLFRQCNKGFAHLVFSDEELAVMGLKPMSTIKVEKNPVLAYQEAIKQAGLKVKTMEVISEMVPDFFLEEPLVRERFLANWGGSEHAMRCEAHIRFVDFQLVHA